MVKQKNLSILSFVLVSFCLNLSQAQTEESVLKGINILPPAPAPAPAPAAAPRPAPTTTPGALGSSGAGFGAGNGTNPQSGLPDAAVTGDSILTPNVSPGKFAEYQSICRTREYDKLKFQARDTYVAKTEELQQKAKALLEQKSGFDLTEGFRLLLDLFSQDDLETFKQLHLHMKKQKLSQMDNETLNGLNGLAIKNLRLARESFLKALQTDDKNEFVLLALAEVYIKELNFYEAGAIYEDLNKIKKNAYLAELCETMVLNSLNADGEKTCLQAARKFPDNPYPLIFAGITHREREDMSKALSMFKRSLNIRPTEMGYACLAELSLIEDRSAEAIQYFKLGLERSPFSPRALLGLAWTEIKNRDYNAALETFKKACKTGNSSYETELRKAYKKLNDEKVAGAERFMQLAQNCN